MSFDVFLSYSSIDRPRIRRLAAGLRSRGLRPWFDEMRAVAGRPFQDDLAAGLKDSVCCAVFVSGRGSGSWSTEEQRVAVDKAAADPRFRVFLVLLPGAPATFDWTTLSPFLTNRTWVDLREIDDDDAAVERLVRAVRGEPVADERNATTGSAAICPYVGLRPFTQDDAPYFHGREADVQRMVEKLRSERFLAVLGRSGSGKSSAVRAGLVPEVLAGAIGGRRDWQVRVITPTARPINVLAGEVIDLEPALSLPQVKAELFDDEGALAIRTRAHRRDGRPLLWVIDQAEELFTLCTSHRERTMFADNLVNASRPGGSSCVVMTIRSDFYPAVEKLPALSHRTANHQYVMTDLSDVDLYAAIEKPARAVGLHLQEGLADRIFSDVSGEPGALPLLEHALFELWEQRSGRVLTHDAYREMQGVRRALGRRADRVLSGFDPAEQEVVRRLLLALINVDDDTEDTKQPAILEDLAAADLPLHRLRRVANALADARLVVTDRQETGTVVDVSHEALIHSWDTLRTWVDESRDDLRMHRRLSRAAADWQRDGRGPDHLYRGASLIAAQEWVDGYSEDLPVAVSDFLAASRRRRVRTVTALSVVAGIAVVAAIAAVALLLRVETETARTDRQHTRALANHALALADTEPALALLAAAEAHHRGPTPATWNTFQQANAAFVSSRWIEIGEVDAHADPVQALAIADGGTTVATTSGDETVKVWDAMTGHRIAVLGTPADVYLDWRVALVSDGRDVVVSNGADVVRWDVAADDVRWGDGGTVEFEGMEVDGNDEFHAAFSVNGAWRAAVVEHVKMDANGFSGTSTHSSVMVWNVETGRRTFVSNDKATGGTVAVSNDGGLVAVAGDRIRVWNTRTGKRVATMRPASAVADGALVFSPDGRRLGAGSLNGNVDVWDVKHPFLNNRLTGHPGGAHGVAFSPDGRTVASGGADGTVKLWDVSRLGETSRSALVSTLAGHRSGVACVGFTSDGSRLVSAGNDGAVRFWEANADHARVDFTHKESSYLDGAQFSDDGTRFVAIADMDTPILWDRRSQQADVLAKSGDPDGARVIAASLSADGALVATAVDSGTVTIKDTAALDVVATVATSNDTVEWVGFGPEGDLAMFGVDDGSHSSQRVEGTLAVWRPSHGRRAEVIADLVNPSLPVYSSDGTMMATAGTSTGVTVWARSDYRRVARFDAGSSWYTHLAFSPDDAYLVTSGDKGVLHLWSVDEERMVGRVDAAADITSLDFSPDGGLLAVGGLGGKVMLYETDGWSRVADLRGHAGQVLEVEFSPDGALLAVAGDDGLRLWDPTTREALVSLDHTTQIHSVEFIDGGSAIAGEGDFLTIWPLVTRPEEVCEIVERYLDDQDVAAVVGEPRLCLDEAR